MSVEGVTLRRLALTATDRGHVRRVLPELEDAMRTASLPGAGRSEVVLVRRLDLGRIAPGTSRQALAVRIEALMAGLSPVVATDSLRTGVRGAQGNALRWPDHVTLLADVAVCLVGKPGGLISGWWVDVALKVPAGSATLQAFGKAVQAMLDNAPVASRPEILGALAARCIALGAIQALFPLATLIVALAADVLSAGAGFKGAVLFKDEGVSSARIATLMQKSAPDLTSALAQASVIAAPLAVLILAHRHGRTGLVRRLLQAGSTPEVSALANADAHAKANEPSSGIAGKRARAEARHGGLLPRQGNAAPLTPVRRARSLGLPGAAACGAETRVSDPVSIMAKARSDVPTWGGGFPILVNLLRLTGINAMEMQLDHPLCLPLARTLLSRLMPDDPLLAALPEAAPPLPLPLVPALPEPMLLALARGVAAIPGHPGRRTLMLRQGCVIGILDGAGLKRIRALEDRLVLRRMPPLKGPLEPALLAGLQLGLSRLLLRHCGRSLRATLRRPGWLAASPTHIDITLDLADVRIAERRAGLDLSPGWVAWAARVILLHFEPMEGRHAS